MGKKKKGRLNWNMLRLLVVCWILPITLLIAGTLYVSASKNRNQMEKIIKNASIKSVENFKSRMEMGISASRNTSYMGTVKEAYLDYEESQNWQQLYNEVTLFLNQQYRYNNTIASTMLFFYDDPLRIYYTYSNVAGATYSSVKEFKKNAYKETLDSARGIKTGICFLNLDDHIYMVRNLVLSDFTPYAVLVMEMNQEVLFESFKNIPWYVDGKNYLDTNLLNSTSAEWTQGINEATKIDYVNGCYYDAKNAQVYLQVPIEKQVFRFIIRLDKAAISLEQDLVWYVFAFILIFTIPLIILLINFFFVNVTKPIRQLSQFSHDIEDGKFGIQIEENQKNMEFSYLVATFNSMSTKLETLFGKIYLEEIALRDANIQALQSQINPHFMNNTLEIINWEARMEGNENVSKMIEALSVMLEATMDRKKEHLVLLSEELSYVDAYLYIIGKRFGQLFHMEKAIDERLLEFKVPRLIIQPIIENAVEHGGDEKGNRDVYLNIYKEKEDVIIEVANNGVMTQEDLQKIQQLLIDGPEENEKSRNLGISNVNKRLKIIYGDESGLTIEQRAESMVLSRIKMKQNHAQNKANNNNYNH